ncbi:MAG: flagellar assembly protein FliH [Spirochaetaceae bacterium]|nr:MAG: flagellar assembly protein FliH [Spirochaetaceae bacterium]
MAKNVFRADEILYQSRKVFIKPPQVEAEESYEEIESLEEYGGPTVEDLRREADEFKTNWEQEKARLIESAREEAEAIKKEAERAAFDEVKRKNNQAQKIRQEAEDEAKRIIEDAKKQAGELEAEIQGKVDKVEKEAFAKGHAEGREEGFQEGRQEVERLIESLQKIISAAIEKRNEIIQESETQVINLVLLIAKKVIKVISENQRNVVINNVVQALRKLKSRGDVVIRVNLADVELTSEHINDFMKMVENVKSVTVLEDSSVDRGGCIIETDFGQIDARISSQLHEIEEKIIELAPIRSKGEG